MSIVPLGIEMQDATVLIVGGGLVGARKSRRFTRAGAHVVILSPTFTDEAFGPPDTEEVGTIEKVRIAPSADRDEAREWLDRLEPLLVVCATDDEAVNETFAAVAREAGILRNRADVAGSEDAGSVVVPATVEDDGVVVSVSTGGKSPALSAYLRELIESEIEGAGAMAALSGDIRTELKERGVEQAQRRAAMRAVVKDAGVWKALRTPNANPRQAAETVVETVVGTQGST